MKSAWRTQGLKDAPLQIIDGDRGCNYPKQNEFFTSGYCIFLNAGNVTADGFKFTNCQFVSKNKDVSLRSGRLKRQDIVMTTRGTIGNIGYYNDYVPYENIRINSGMVILRCDTNRLLPSFLYHCLRSSSFRSQINAFRSGAAQPQLPIRDLKYLQIPIPPIQYQASIASVLSAYDDLIENNLRRIKILEEMAQNLYREWFVKFRFPGWQNTRFVDSPLGRIPEGWEVVKVEDILDRVRKGVKIQKTQYLEKGLIPVIDQGKTFVGGYTDNAEALISSDIPIIVFGDHTRIVKFIDFPFACGADGIQLLKSNNARMPMSLFYYTLLSIDLSDYAYARHFKFLKSQQLLLPDTVISEQFDAYVSKKLEMISALSKRNNNLRQTRDLLLPKLISGEIDVSELDINVNVAEVN